MPKRRLRMVKTISPLLWVCEGCNSQFRSEAKDLAVALLQVASAFKRHKCTLQDNGQNVLRVVRDATEDN